jgi:hypothetical protein
MKIILYVKTHNITGLKYFGKTTKGNPDKYSGSGKYWKRHIKKHGKDISTRIIGTFDSQASATEAALEFSRSHNIVESDDWANLMVENGLDGAPVGHEGHIFTETELQAMSDKLKARWSDPEYKQKMIQTHKDRWTDDKKAAQTKRLKTEFWTEERKASHSAKMSGRKNPLAFGGSLKGKPKSDEHRAKISAGSKGKPKSDAHRKALSEARKRMFNPSVK